MSATPKAMARKIRFTPLKTDAGWRLNIPAKLSESGKRERHFYRTHELAKSAAAVLKEKVETFGIQARAIAPSLAEQATAAAALLAPYGASLLDAARMLVDIRDRETASRPVGLAADAWLVACEGLRTKTQQGYRQTANRLKAALGERILATLTGEELQAALTPPGTPATAAAGHVGRGKAFWNWCAESGWCRSETFSSVKPPKSSREADEIGILTVPEAEALLRVAESHFPQAVSSFALQLFAGIRAEEITRLESGHVTAEGIDLPASVTKKGRRRHITPSPTLAAWLAKYPYEPCSNWRRVDRACRRLAGWEVVSDLVIEAVVAGRMPEPQKPMRGPWPQNALRHSHASYAVAAGVPLEALLFEFGHAGNPSLLRQHYVGRASKKQAIQFFSIAPEGVEIPNFKIA